MKFIGIASELRTPRAIDIICLVIHDGLLTCEYRGYIYDWKKPSLSASGTDNSGVSPGYRRTGFRYSCHLHPDIIRTTPVNTSRLRRDTCFVSAAQKWFDIYLKWVNNRYTHLAHWIKWGVSVKGEKSYDVLVHSQTLWHWVLPGTACISTIIQNRCQLVSSFLFSAGSTTWTSNIL